MCAYPDMIKSNSWGRRKIEGNLKAAPLELPGTAAADPALSVLDGRHGRRAASTDRQSSKPDRQSQAPLRACWQSLMHAAQIVEGDVQATAAKWHSRRLLKPLESRANRSTPYGLSDFAVPHNWSRFARARRLLPPRYGYYGGG